MRRRLQISAFTLLELLLTLSMSVVLMALVGGAMQFYARDMNVRDLDIRQTQLAAAVMQMLEDDLRATLHTEPVDTAPLAELLAATASVTGGEEAPTGDASAEDLAAAGIADEPETVITDTTETLDLQSGVAVLETPGLIGNQYQIQLDLSRLPRLEEYVALLDGSNTEIDDVPSDIKTVAYFVQQADTLGGVQDPLQQLLTDDTTLADTQPAGGLVRRSLDRAATAYASTNGNLITLNQTGELLAPEIQGIEFQYWDGLTWQLEWSSDDYGELPLAIQITLYMADPRVEATSTTTSETLRTFKHIVRLPMAKMIEEEEEELSEAGI
ncbi:MAG: prepilin-type cleavage/methylation domain-containing protein [Rubripirellula sp.]|nr:prepilin-type cleavage/methylation domain-containing protein [Planctomycetaceae bacterium]MDF1845409.1 prepilin-type cleavage/methylation domain-containing protein [Rubripirellula sp.]